MPAGIQGVRGTGEFSTDFRPKNYREYYTLLEPNGNAPLNALLAMGSSESTNDPEYKNFRDELPDRVVTTAAAVADDSTGNITLTNDTDNKYLVKGAIVVNATTGEVMHVTTGVTGTALVVTRNIGGTTFQIASGAKLFVAGFAAAENSDVGTPITFDATVASNYTQIFRTPFGVSNTLNATYLRTGNKMQEAAEKALKMHMSDIERAMFFGRKAEAGGTGATPTRYTGGLLTTMSNVVDIAADYATYGGAAAGEMTESGFDQLLMSTVFKFGSKQKIAFVGETAANLLQQVGKKRWSPTTIDATYGINLTGYKTYAGEIMVHLHPQFRQLPNMKSAMVILDFPHLMFRHLEGRDTSMLENRQGNGVDGQINEYLTECGLELLQDKVHSYVKGWTKLV